jgi:hypothetical protein
MKLCLITNYVNKGYIEETLILNQLIDTLELLPEDVIEFKNENQVYSLNQYYTHALVLLNSEITSYQYIVNFLSELTIPKIFIVDTIPEVEKDLNTEFVKNFSIEKDYVYSTLKTNEWNELYSLSDGFIFYNEKDKHLFNEKYISNKVVSCVIPPSLGKKEFVKLNEQNIIKTNNIGYNGTPSYSKGIFHLEFYSKYLNNFNFSLYGSHGKNPVKNENIVNYLTEKYPNINFYGKLKDYNKFYLNNYIYYDCSLYNSFSYFMYLSLINGVVPIISKNTSSSEYLSDYPFSIEYANIESFNNIFNQINNISVSELRSILFKTVEDISWINNSNCKNLYKEFITNHL